MDTYMQLKDYKDQSDEDLVILVCKSKDTFVYGVIYDRYEHLVYNKCYGFVRNVDEAKDLTQDVFLQVFIKLTSFKGNSKFSTWLYSVTYHFCVNYLNRDKEKKIASLSKPVEEEYSLAAEISDDSLFQLKVDRLEKALREMPPEERMLIQMKYQDNASIKELQEVLEISESAVKMRLSRAKTKILEIYQQMEV